MGKDISKTNDFQNFKREFEQDLSSLYHSYMKKCNIGIRDISHTSKQGYLIVIDMIKDHKLPAKTEDLIKLFYGSGATVKEMHDELHQYDVIDDYYKELLP